MGTIASYDVRKKLSAIPASLPVLVIHGSKDRASSLSSSVCVPPQTLTSVATGSVYFSERKYIERGIPHAQIAKLPNEAIGHMCGPLFLNLG